MRRLLVQGLFSLGFVLCGATYIQPVLAEAVQAAADHQPGRFAAREELQGGWKRITLPADVASKYDERWPAQVQYFRFEQNGLLNSMMISNDKDPELNGVALEQVLKGLKGVSYKLEQDGMLTVTYDDIPGFEERWGVNIFLEDHKSARLGNIDFKKGDLMMTLDASTYDKAQAGVIYIRHLRRVE